MRSIGVLFDARICSPTILPPPWRCLLQQSFHGTMLWRQRCDSGALRQDRRVGAVRRVRAIDADPVFRLHLGHGGTQIVALNHLARDGVSAIWQLHVEAAAAYIAGDLSTAEEQWLRQLVKRPVSGLRQPIRTRTDECWGFTGRRACLFATCALAQQANNSAVVEHKDIGRVRGRTETFNQALGVVSELARSSATQTGECYGRCIFPSFGRDIVWLCAPKQFLPIALYQQSTSRALQVIPALHAMSVLK